MSDYSGATAGIVIGAFVIGGAIESGFRRLSSALSRSNVEIVAAMAGVLAAHRLGDPRLNRTLETFHDAEARAQAELTRLALDGQRASPQGEAAQAALADARKAIEELDVFGWRQHAKLVDLAWEVYDRVRHTQAEHSHSRA